MVVASTERFWFMFIQFGVEEDLEYEIAGSGNLNDVVRIFKKGQKDESSVIVKYAPPFIKVTIINILIVKDLNALFK